MTLSPMMRQYLNTKEKYKDCILFYRLGDFYEMFFDDALKVSKLLDLALTGRDCGLAERAPMCGVPYHAANTYIAKLIEKGEKVAICEQLTQPSGKGIVERGVVKVISAGTITDESQLDERKNNFLMAIFAGNESCAYSYCDITTGDFFAGEFLVYNLNNIVDFILTISPAEIICNSKFYEQVKDHYAVINTALPKPQLYADWAFNISSAKKTLLDHFKILSLDAFEIQNSNQIIGASGALIEYLKETQMNSLLNINKITKTHDKQFLVLDYNAVRNLELVKSLRDGAKYGTLIWLLDKTVTAMGARTLNNWLLKPLYDINAINNRLNGVEAFYNSHLICRGVRDILQSVKDIERLVGKLANNNFSARDSIALKNSISAVPTLKLQLSGLNAQIIDDLNTNLTTMPDIVQLIERAISENCPQNEKDGDYISDGYNKQLDELRNISKYGKNIIAEIEQREKNKTGIKNLKIGFNRVFGYYIEVTNSFKELVPYTYIRRQTLANAERFITDELKEAEEKILNAQVNAIKLEEELFNEIKQILISKIVSFQQIAKSVAVIDCLSTLALLAKENNYVKPKLVDGCFDLDIKDGRHPVVEKIVKDRFVANDSFLNCNQDRMIILTGPNMAGKSTYMRQVALITIMAHLGSFVPAAFAQIPLTDRIFTRIGASDNLVLDQSTFMVEMTETASILNNATKSSLIILDEIGRGTSTFDGLSIAWAVVEYLTTKIFAKTLFATHYHELTELQGLLDGVKNYKITVKEFGGKIIFLRKIAKGGANKSFGIEVAQLAGLPNAVIQNAKVVLSRLEKADITVSYAAPEQENTVNYELIKLLEGIDIENLSPIEALNTLNEVVKASKKLS